MVLSDKPNIYLSTAFVIASIFVFGGWPLPAGWWSVPIGSVLLCVGAFEVWNWAKFQAATHLLWENTAKAARLSTTLQTLHEFAAMPLARLEAMINVLYIQYGTDEQEREAIFREMRGALDAMKREAEEAARMDASKRWYGVDVINWARENNGYLPSLRKTGEGTQERAELERLTNQLVKIGAAEPAVGPKPARIVDMERAEQTVRLTGA